ncbi:type II toxin-antitoxin system PemK/MazF family toxin [Agrobacterium vitis]|uniref:type II toxin-antitoxin system PemK/MazF family toxin n=1 Tax=Rhizobium/Agrobacterium group TaxID=227290 RepID=UPI001321CE85|nr:type II toxin-antitoxin system PemK/MazF family toxin [Allorhizobium ampelinum]MVA48534.1 type II toxin-antitoxin system PemK/MazF family toxin [Agrobacterium vitis]
MKRGDLVTVAVPDDFGKPRPALIIQSDFFSETGTATVLLISSTLVDAPLLRVTVQPSHTNDLKKPSQIMVDKAMSIRRERLGPAFGRLDDDTMLSVTRSLAVFFGFG